MEDETKGYKQLLVWQRAMDLVPMIYVLTKRFPRDEIYGLSSQLRRAMVSVSSNIAEGHGRYHKREYFHFLSIARGSLAEVDTLITVANRLGYIHEQTLQKVEGKIIPIRKMLQKLMQSQLQTSPSASRLPPPA